MRISKMSVKNAKLIFQFFFARQKNSQNRQEMKYQILKSMMILYGFGQTTASVSIPETGDQCTGSNCEQYHKRKTIVKTRAIKHPKVESVEKQVEPAHCATNSQSKDCSRRSSSVSTKKIVTVIPVFEEPHAVYETQRTDIDTTVYKRPSKLRSLFRPKEKSVVAKTVSTADDIDNNSLSRSTKSVTVIEEPKRRRSFLHRRQSKECCETRGDATVCSECDSKVVTVERKTEKTVKPEMLISRSKTSDETIEEPKKRGLLSRIPRLRQSSSAQCCEKHDDKTVCSDCESDLSGRSEQSLSAITINEEDGKPRSVSAPAEQNVQRIVVKVPVAVKLTGKQKR